MKFGAHQNWCNGPGDCSCGEDYRVLARETIKREREADEEEDRLYSNPKALRKKAAELIKAAEELEK